MRAFGTFHQDPSSLKTSEAQFPASGRPSSPLTGPPEQIGSVETGDDRRAQVGLHECSSAGFREERLLLPFYLFAIALRNLSAKTMRVSWLAVAVVVVATLR